VTIHNPELHRQAKHYAAVRSRLLGAPKRVMLKVEIQPGAPVVSKPVRPLTTREQQNEYIKLRCRMLKTSYKDITAEHMSNRVLALRDQILMEVKEKWPRARAKRLGDLFHRTEKGVLAIFAKFKIKSPDRPVTPEAVGEMRQLREGGMTYQKIGELFGVGPNTVKYHLSKKERA
jgi:hypothetical protein